MTRQIQSPASAWAAVRRRQHLAGRELPVGGEAFRELRHRGPAHAKVQIRHAPVVRLADLAPADVHAADESGPAVGDEELAMVTQIE